MPSTRCVRFCCARTSSFADLLRQQFPGRQKIIISKKWGFTNLSRAEYLEKRSIAQPDGAYVQVRLPCLPSTRTWSSSALQGFFRPCPSNPGS